MVVRAALVRHQAAACVATVVDFAVMILLVSGAGAAPAAGTALGAACGGVTNFILGRRWVFRAHGHRRAPQAARYLLVTLGSLLLNTAGVHLLAVGLHAQYVAARIVVAIAVSILWNYPMQRTFVFRARSA